jgi:RNA polymerase sigma-70 factor (ECF subfamily)
MPDRPQDALTSDAETNASDDDASALAALRAGDEGVFAMLVERYTGALQRLALVYVRDAQVAEEVVQETWIGLLQSIERFEGRSSLKTWLFRILMNCARSRARKESRSIPFSALPDAVGEANDPIVPAERFLPATDQYAGHWAAAPSLWHQSPELQAVSSEVRSRIKQAIRILPDAQREVITLRDVDGLSSLEVCNLLQISDTNQRVLLHRARGKVRRELEAYLGEEAVS